MYLCVCQMQFLFSRLASPPTVNCDFDDDVRNDVMSSADDHSSSQQSRVSVLPSAGLQLQQDYSDTSRQITEPDSASSVRQKANCAERLRHSGVPSVQQQKRDHTQKSGLPTIRQLQDCVGQQLNCANTSHDASVQPEAQYQDYTTQQSASASRFDLGLRQSDRQSDHTAKSDYTLPPSDAESLVSLNELLDDCCHSDTDAGETFAIDCYDADECSVQPSVSQLSEIVNLLHVSVDTAEADFDDHHVPEMSDSGRPRLALNSQPGKSVCSGDELSGQTEADAADVMQTRSHCSPVMSPLMQHGFAESNVSSLSDQAHTHNAYRSNATSATSQEAPALLCVM